MRIKKWMTFALLALVVICIAIASRPYFQAQHDAAPDGSLELHFIDVGQGDAALILCDGHAMLIDGGTPKNSSRIYHYLQTHEIKHLDYIIATHPHDDHVGGLAGALNFAEADTAFCSVSQAEGRAFQSFIKYLDQQGTALSVPAPGEKYSLGSAEFSFLAPLRESEKMNNNSLVIRLTYGSFCAMFMGDAEIDEESDLLASHSPLNCNLLKVGHHGSANASSEAFLSAASPELAVISCGKNNEYNHPSAQTLERLSALGSEILRTDQSGDIVVTVWPDGMCSYTGVASAEAADESDAAYIVNTKSGKFHKPDCPSAQEIRPENRMETGQSREELLSQGYEPCGRCKP